MKNLALERLFHPKYRRRLGWMLTNALNHLLLPVFNPVIALLVIRFKSPDLWGSFVNMMIVIQFGAHVISWGNREYLLRSFSRRPDRIREFWSKSLSARFLLFFVFAAVLVLWGLPPLRWTLAVVWGLSLAIEQSFDVFVLYKKDFRFEFGVELGAILLLVLGIIWRIPQLDLDFLILWFALSNLGKSALYTLRYKGYILSKRSAGSERIAGTGDFFLQAFPFFLLGFSGMLQSRIDLYSVSFYFPERDVAQYQVLSNLLIYLQSLANFILLPFVKNIYRLPFDAIRPISNRLFLVGLVILIPGVTGIYLTLTYLYDIHFSAPFFLWGGLFVLPLFYYLPIIYSLYKANQQNKVLMVNLGGAALTLTLNLGLLPRFGLVGAVASTAIVRWAVFFVYARLSRRLA